MSVSFGQGLDFLKFSEGNRRENEENRRECRKNEELSRKNFDIQDLISYLNNFLLRIFNVWSACTLRNRKFGPRVWIFLTKEDSSKNLVKMKKNKKHLDKSNKSRVLFLIKNSLLRRLNRYS